MQKIDIDELLEDTKHLKNAEVKEVDEEELKEYIAKYVD